MDQLMKDMNSLQKTLSFEQHLNRVLETIRNYSLVLINGCNCHKSSNVFQNLNKFNAIYNELKAKQTLSQINNEMNGQNDGLDSEESIEELEEWVENCDNFESNSMENSIESENIENSFTESAQKRKRSGNQRKSKVLKQNNSVIIRCEECEQTFGSEQELERHVIRHQSIEKKFNHLRQYFNDFNDTNGQNLCQTKDTNIGSHVEQMSNKRLELWPSLSGSEVSIDGSNEVIYRCKECHEIYENKLDLKIHVNRDHVNTESYLCHECRQVFGSKEQFCTHLLTKHMISMSDLDVTEEDPNTDSKPFIFNQSNELFESNVDLMQRFNNIHNSVPKVLSFNSIININVVPNDQHFQCHKCPKVCKSIDLLLEHIIGNHRKDHSMPSPVKSFKCDSYGCDKTFELKSLLDEHKCIHYFDFSSDSDSDSSFFT